MCGGVFSEVHFHICTPSTETIVALLIHSFPRRKAQFLYMSLEHSHVRTSWNVKICTSVPHWNQRTLLEPQIYLLAAYAHWSWFQVALSLSLSLSVHLSPAGAVLVLQKHIGVEQRFLQPGCPHEPVGVLLLPAWGSAWRSATDHPSMTVLKVDRFKKVHTCCFFFLFFFWQIAHLGHTLY